MPHNNLTEKAGEHYSELIGTLEAAATTLSPDAFVALMAHVTEDLDEVLFDLMKGKQPAVLFTALKMKHNL